MEHLSLAFQPEGRIQSRMVRSSDTEINRVWSSLNRIEKITPWQEERVQFNDWVHIMGDHCEHLSQECMKETWQCCDCKWGAEVADSIHEGKRLWEGSVPHTKCKAMTKWPFLKSYSHLYSPCSGLVVVSLYTSPHMQARAHTHTQIHTCTHTDTQLHVCVPGVHWDTIESSLLLNPHSLPPGARARSGWTRYQKL